MEGTQSITRARTTGKDGNQVASKPLHRFIQNEPKTLGIVILIFGCAEILIGFRMDHLSSVGIYAPFWQGALFLICGYLSIYTEIHPSKKMVTVCLAMYVASLFGIIVSVGYRIHLVSYYAYIHYIEMILVIESIFITSSLLVSGILIFLCVIARLALKSTRTQVIVQHFPPPPSDTTAN
ncbi:membrane-spanning 4-domains subfamily A member 4D-like [Cottoperca gobio]|uniref:Membrane-spanning 4-domains subfamily A member 4D-like n=1 Tax=Cottoperca gobio TaxID=56716 RepID=A0A6J2QJ69_COTGO|nr:membrane-spanning 4-domains subfamily A member 4D-like [Cottoperca gobio]